MMNNIFFDTSELKHLGKNVIIGNSYFDKKNFCAVIKTNKIIATQFHPEKSGLDGLNFLPK